MRGMINIRIKVDDKNLQRVLTAYGNAIGIASEKVPQEILNRIKDKANENFDKSKFHDKNAFASNPTYGLYAHPKDSWYITRHKKGSYTMMNMSPYASFVEYGTGVRGGKGTITAEGDKPMKWINEDGEWLTAWVTLGQAPHYFFSNAVNEVRNEILEIAYAELRKATPGVK